MNDAVTLEEWKAALETYRMTRRATYAMHRDTTLILALCRFLCGVEEGKSCVESALASFREQCRDAIDVAELRDIAAEHDLQLQDAALETIERDAIEGSVQAVRDVCGLDDTR